MIKVFFFLLPLTALAQMKASFSDPARPGTLRVELISGGITVSGTSGREVIVEARGGEGRSRDRNLPAGMKRIGGSGGELTMREENNVIRIEADGWSTQHLDIQVPVKTSLVLKTVNSGNIRVENVEGEIEAQNVNGNIEIFNVSGAVVANSVNGKVEATLNHAAPDKPMSFTTLNGKIDVTFPPDLKATLRLRADNGDMYTDFDMAISNERNVTSTAKGRQRMENTTVGKVNGGGPEIRLQTMNGRIYIRKKQ
jgi:hypothetical protein